MHARCVKTADQKFQPLNNFSHLRSTHFLLFCTHTSDHYKRQWGENIQLRAVVRRGAPCCQSLLCLRHPVVVTSFLLFTPESLDYICGETLTIKLERWHFFSCMQPFIRDQNPVKPLWSSLNIRNLYGVTFGFRVCCIWSKPIQWIHLITIIPDDGALLPVVAQHSFSKAFNAIYPNIWTSNANTHSLVTS